jgi:hypothetical protein
MQSCRLQLETSSSRHLKWGLLLLHQRMCQFTQESVCTRASMHSVILLKSMPNQRRVYHKIRDLLWGILSQFSLAGTNLNIYYIFV